MKPLGLLASIAAMAALASPAAAQQRSVSSGARVAVPNSPNLFSWERGHGFKGGFGGGVWIVEREVPVYVEVPVPAANVGTPNTGVPEIRRKPYVIGASYASLPGGCMKLVEEGVSFYYCSGEWYRQVGERRGASYRAVARRL